MFVAHKDPDRHIFGPMSEWLDGKRLNFILCETNNSYYMEWKQLERNEALKAYKEAGGVIKANFDIEVNGFTEMRHEIAFYEVYPLKDRYFAPSLKWKNKTPPEPIRLHWYMTKPDPDYAAPFDQRIMNIIDRLVVTKWMVLTPRPVRFVSAVRSAIGMFANTNRYPTLGRGIPELNPWQ